MPETKSNKTARRIASRALVVWLVALGALIVDSQVSRLLRMFHRSSGFLGFISFLAWLILLAITLYWIALAIRWILRKVFWRVGRRLFLSYVLIGVLPFILMTVLGFIVAWTTAGVMSQAALRGERQTTLGQMEAWSLEYAMLGKKPTDGLSTLEIYDSADGSTEKLPEWLRKTAFSGMAWRDSAPLFVSARQYSPDNRSVVFVQPLDKEWVKWLEEQGGMIISFEQTRNHRDSSGNKIRVRKKDQDIEIETGDNFNSFFRRAWGLNRVIWGDLTDLTNWETGGTAADHQLFTFISNPISNLVQFYFGASNDEYIRILVRIIVGVVALLMLIYVMASLFAAILIFSISRAVNRIEKGTQAVERGDFSYRIAMKPRNQLGQMAQSFDHMTESIALLLVKVAEKERLQSEIDIAASIQRNLLPKEGPRLRGVTFSAHFEPTASIGGDYYDLFSIDKSRLGVAIGDVSGHGLSTGLVMAMVKAAITTLVEEGADELSIFARLNDLVHRSTERRAFMTLAFTIFDFEHARIRHTNAGHLYPYLLRAGEPPYAIECPSLPLGVRNNATARTVELDLHEGDALVYLSDGIVEAQDETGEPFGFDQLEALLAAVSGQMPPEIQETILAAVARHSGTRPADDDRTVMVLRFDQLPVSGHNLADNETTLLAPAVTTS
jgi:serine phosphatase RsbU (regulator of sigma subunit)